MKRAITRTYVIAPAEVREAVVMWLKARDVPQPPLSDKLRLWVETGNPTEGGHEINVLFLQWNETTDDEPKKK